VQNATKPVMQLDATVVCARSIGVTWEGKCFVLNMLDSVRVCIRSNSFFEPIMRKDDIIIEKLFEVLDTNAVSAEVLKYLLRYQRIPSRLNEQSLHSSVNKAIVTKTVGRMMNPFFVEDEDAARMSKGEICLGLTPEGYSVKLDLELEHTILVPGASGTGKTNLLASICLQLDQLDPYENENRAVGLLEQIAGVDGNQ